jgi:hypothetical protein
VIGGQFFDQLAECQIFQKVFAPWNYFGFSTSISASSHIWKMHIIQMVGVTWISRQ